MKIFKPIRMPKVSSVARKALASFLVACAGVYLISMESGWLGLVLVCCAIELIPTED